jgi:hypothetical protein
LPWAESKLRIPRRLAKKPFRLISIGQVLLDDDFGLARLNIALADRSHQSASRLELVS